jgi:hypothetical protein
MGGSSTLPKDRPVDSSKTLVEGGEKSPPFLFDNL